MLSDLLHDIPGVLNSSDDILVQGETQSEYDQRLDEVLKRLLRAGFTAHPGKCEFNKQNIKFFGMEFSNKGVKLDEMKLKALLNAPGPRNAAELRSYLGLASYCSMFIPNYVTLSAPLRHLIKKTNNLELGTRSQRCNAVNKEKSVY